MVCTGVISSLNLPSACAAAAFRWELTANLSWVAWAKRGKRGVRRGRAGVGLGEETSSARSDKT